MWSFKSRHYGGKTLFLRRRFVEVQHHARDRGVRGQLDGVICARDARFADGQQLLGRLRVRAIMRQVALVAGEQHIESYRARPPVLSSQQNAQPIFNQRHYRSADCAEPRDEAIGRDGADILALNEARQGQTALGR